MPKIPQFNRSVSIQRPGVPAPVPGAFGQVVQDASARQGQAIAQIGDVLAKHAAEWQQSVNEKAVLDADTKFRIAMQNELYDDKADDTGKAKGIYARKLGFASGATIDFDTRFAEISKKHEDALSNSRQKELFQKLSGSYYKTERESVIRHEAAQTREAFTSSLDANIKQRVSDAALIADPAQLQSSIQDAVAIASNGIRRQGGDDTMIAQGSQRIAGEMAQRSIAALLDKDFSRAQAVFAKVRPALGGDDVAAIEKMLRGKEQLVKQQGVWESVKGLAGSDGLPDTGKMLAQVTKLNLQPAEQEQMQDYIRGKAGELAQIIRQDRANKDYAFMKDLYAAKQAGKPLDEALKVAGSYGRDAYDHGVKAAAARTLYANPRDTNPEAYMRLWRGVVDATATQEAIDNNMMSGAISLQDWESLSKELYLTQIKGSSPAVKDAWDRVELIAAEKFGKNKERRDQFMYVVRNATKGKTPEEIITIANDKLKADPSTGILFHDKQWESDLKRLDAENTAWGKMYQDIGKREVDAIGRGLLFGGAAKYGIADIDTFVGTLGGYDAVKAGTPAHEAIQYLVDRGELVTVKNVQAVIEYLKREKK